MRIVAVDSSTDWLSVCAFDGRDAIALRERAGTASSERMLPLLRQALDEAGWVLAELDGIAYGAGPGSFTGIRIACGVAQGLAFAAHRPVVPVPSLLALAEQSNERRVVAALDARMNEAYIAAYARNGEDWDEVIAPRLADAASLPSLPGRQWAATGSGFERLPWLRDAYLDVVQMRYGADLPRAGAVARLAARVLARGGAVAAEDAAPLYLRDKVALTTDERRARR